MNPFLSSSTARELKVAGAALNQTPLDWKGNRRTILSAMAASRRRGVHLLCLPELCISGYGCEDAFYGQAVIQSAWESLLEIIPHSQQLIVTVGLPISYEGSRYNAVALLVDGHLVGLNAKRTLAGYGVHYEPRWFSAWRRGLRENLETPLETSLETPLKNIPIGDLSYQIGDLRLGFEICEEAWTGKNRQLDGGTKLDVLINPSASHFALGKYETMRNLVLEGSRQAQAIYIYCNLLGNEAGNILYDGSVMIASQGTMLAELPRFSYHPIHLSCVDVKLRQLAKPLPRYNQKHKLMVSVAPPAHLPAPSPPAPPSDMHHAKLDEAHNVLVAAKQAVNLSPEEEFLQAVSLGIWDYLRKSRTQGCLISLSGGADSSSVAMLCSAMIRFALQELGPTGIKKTLPHVKGLDHALPTSASTPISENDIRTLTRKLLLTVYQASANSSENTRQIARELADDIGACHLELNTQPMVAAYESMVEEALQYQLSWKNDDLARQNIQARVRSPSIWMIANIKNFLLLGTSNRSELAVGYTTTDGDTSCGFAPIAGASKTFLRQWLKWMETSPPFKPSKPSAQGRTLAALNNQAPTAELRPLTQAQKDENDLMPYSLLDDILQAAIGNRMSPLQIWQYLRVRPRLSVSPRLLAEQIAKFFRLWGGSQWKRERLAPSLHVDDYNLDPRTWCRFPILASGWQEELEELQNEADKLTRSE